MNYYLSKKIKYEYELLKYFASLTKMSWLCSWDLLSRSLEGSPVLKTKGLLVF
jgi:hypothetical protein